jgi:predicted RNase H-like HicB family nuclease
MSEPEVVIEEEANGTFSAWVPSVPGIYAMADTRADAERAIRKLLMERAARKIHYEDE